MEFPMRIIVVIMILLIAFAVFLLLISKWSASGQGLLGGLFDFFGTVTKSASGK